MDKKSVSDTSDAKVSTSAAASPAQTNTILPVDSAPQETPAAAPEASTPAETATVETSAPAAETPATPVATTPQPTPVVAAPQKKKTGLIIGIIIGVLLLLGGIIFAIWYFAFYQNPENVAFDAMNKFFSAEHVSPHGAIATKITTDDDYEITLTLMATNASRRLPNASNVDLILGIVDDQGESLTEKAIQLGIGTVQMSDGVVYFKLDKLTQLFDQLIHEIVPASCGELQDCLGVPESVQTALYDLADLMDEQWWRISLSEILEEIDDLEVWQADVITDLYTCAIDAMSADNGAELASLYRRNSFVKVERIAVDSYPSGTSAYSASLDYYALSAFVNAAKNIKSANAFYDCYNSVIDRVAEHYSRESSYYDAEDFEEYKISADTMDDLSAADLKDLFPADTKITLFIDDWGHTLREIGLEFEINDQPVTIGLGFEYEAVEVTAPEEYRPITELFDEFADLVGELIPGPGFYYPDDDYEYDFSCHEDDPRLCLNDIDYSAFDFYGV